MGEMVRVTLIWVVHCAGASFARHEASHMRVCVRARNGGGGGTFEAGAARVPGVFLIAGVEFITVGFVACCAFA